MGTERVSERYISLHNADVTQEHVTSGNWRLGLA